MYGNRPPYGLRLVRKSGSHEPQTCRSPQRAAHEPAIVMQLRVPAAAFAAYRPSRVARVHNRTRQLAAWWDRYELAEATCRDLRLPCGARRRPHGRTIVRLDRGRLHATRVVVGRKESTLCREGLFRLAVPCRTMRL
jgi:hypothetical protein